MFIVISINVKGVVNWRTLVTPLKIVRIAVSIKSRGVHKLFENFAPKRYAQ
jgi:hypothetical protein